MLQADSSRETKKAEKSLLLRRFTGNVWLPPVPLPLQCSMCNMQKIMSIAPGWHAYSDLISINLRSTKYQNGNLNQIIEFKENIDKLEVEAKCTTESLTIRSNKQYKNTNNQV